VEKMENIEKYIIQKKDNLGGYANFVNMGLTKIKTWNRCIKYFGFQICKNKTFLENNKYYIHKNIYCSLLEIIAKN